MRLFLRICKIIGILMITLYITSICPGPLTINLMLMCGVLGIINEIGGIRNDKILYGKRNKKAEVNETKEENS